MLLTVLGWSLIGLLFVVFCVFLYLAWLDEIDTPSVSHVANGSTVRVLFRSRVARAVKWLTRGRVYGFPVWRRVYFACAESRLVRGQIAHEVHHCRQWEDLGALRGFVAYMRGYLRHGYIWHPMELEARTVAEESLGLV